MNPEEEEAADSMRDEGSFGMTIPSMVGPKEDKKRGVETSAETISEIDFVLRQSTIIACLSGSSGHPTLLASFLEYSTASEAIAHGLSADPETMIARWKSPVFFSRCKVFMYKQWMQFQGTEKMEKRKMGRVSHEWMTKSNGDTQDKKRMKKMCV